MCFIEKVIYTFPHLKAFASFVAHQCMSTIGIIVISAFQAFSVCSLIHPLNASVGSKQASWILTEVPGFPIQVLVGFTSGLVLARKRRHNRTMQWVWILPLAFLCFGVLTFLRSSSVISVTSSSSIISHFFGRGCELKEHCLDQIGFTLPFLASSAYAIGALFARFQIRRIKRETPAGGMSPA